MPKLYFEIIDECIDKFRLEGGRTFNFSLLDFRDEVFHNYGFKPSLSPNELSHLLTHAQKYVCQFGRSHPAVKKLAEYLATDLKNLPPSEEHVREIFDIVFEGKLSVETENLTPNDVARFVGFLPLKHNWDNSGVLYRRTCEDEASFSKIYLCQYCYDEQHRRPADALCREVEIPENSIDPDHLKQKLIELHQQAFRLNAEYFRLEPHDQDLYELYGRLYDLLNWGASNPQSVIDYLDARSQQFAFYDCVFPVVIHGIYYGVAYFDLPQDFFQSRIDAIETLSHMLKKGWTYVNHYFPAIIIDAYNSRLISRYTREQNESAEELVTLVNSKVPFRFCYNSSTGMVYFFNFEHGGIAKRLNQLSWPPGLDWRSTPLRERFLTLDFTIDAAQLRFVQQEILNHKLIFVFDLNFLPGREKCLPILESHLAQAAFVLQTMKDQGERHVFEERNRMLDMLAHDNKTTRELLISDLEEGMDSELAALQLHEQNLKERVLHDYLLRRPSMYGDIPAGQESKIVDLSDLFAGVFRNTWRVWLKSRRFRASLRRNRHPDFPLHADSSREEINDFMHAFFMAYSHTPERACLELLRSSFLQLSPGARLRVNAPPLLMMEHAVFRVEAILYNLLCNFFKHAAPSPLTGYNECVMELSATSKPDQIDFSFHFSNSTSTRERFAGEVQALLGAKHEIHGLQIILYLIEKDAGAHPPVFKVKQEDYIWHIEVGRECYGCFENTLVDAHSRRSP